jgi:hypothetical protein
MYLEVDEGFFDHPKTLRVSRMLKDDKACLYILRLWRWACRCAPTGSLAGMTPDEIEQAAGYPQLDGKLYDALASRFIDEKDGAPFALHDWMKHQGAAIKRMMSRADAKRSGARERQKRKRLREDNDVSCHAFVTPTESVTSRFVTPPVQSSPVQTRPDQSRSGEAPTELSPRPPERSSGTPVPGLEFPCDGQVRSWQLTFELLEQWTAAYPSLDLEAECRKALVWVQANPARKKTASGMSKFLLGWFGRAQNNGGGNLANGPPLRSTVTQVTMGSLGRFLEKS